jgi:Tfp pilus assembly protein FimT
MAPAGSTKGSFTNEQGINLFEILLTTAIIGIVGQIAVVNLVGQLPKKRLQGATNQIVWDLMAARMKAIMQNHDRIKVTFVDTHTYTIWDDVNNDDVVNADEAIAKTSNLHDGSPDVNLAKPLPRTFGFSSKGAANRTQDMDLGNQSGAYRITISRNDKATSKKIH